MKACTICQQTKSLSEFHKHREAKDGHRNQCKACKAASAARYYASNAEIVRGRAKKWYAENTVKARARKAEWTLANPKGHRGSYLRARYGITVEERQAQIDAQAGQCAICSTSFADIPDRHVHVDHCHSTGSLRGMLCHWCNTRLGVIEGDAEWLNKASEYIVAGGQWAGVQKLRSAA